MKIAVDFSSEWQHLQQRRAQLVKEGDEFRIKLHGLSDEPEMQLLIQEKRRLGKTEVPRLQGEIECRQQHIDGLADHISRRHRAATDKKILQNFGERLLFRRERLKTLKRLQAPRVIIENEERMVWEIEAPIAEVESRYLLESEQEQQEKQALEDALNEVFARIEKIDSHYRDTKKYLQEAIRVTGEELSDLLAEGIEWLTQDREHLEWALENVPSYRSDILVRYRARFPQDKLLDLIPSDPRPEPPVSKKREKTRPTHPAFVPPTTTVSTIPLGDQWKFSVTFHHKDVGLELPEEEVQFLEALRQAFNKADYHNLGVELVYDKLHSVSKLDVQQRQTMNKVTEGEPLGWKILRAGKQHRLFLLIDEDKRHIRFLPCPRKLSYSGH